MRSVRSIVIVVSVILGVVSSMEPAIAAFPGENGRIAFAMVRNGRLGIYSINPDGSARVRLTNGIRNGGDAYPAWSPDGTKIVFERGVSCGCDPSTTSRPDIYVMNADGSDLTRLTRNGSNFFPTWSPDGAKIVFGSVRGGHGGIFTMNPDGSGVTRLTQGRDFAPAWSPGGAEIVFSRSTNRRSQLYVMGADGSSVTRLTSGAPGASYPKWSPDGTEIVFTGDGIETMHADGSARTRLTDGSYPAWSPDGATIAFFGSTDIHTVGLDGSNLMPVTTTNGRFLFFGGPDWQPLPPA